jgi:hypothetical protein
MRERWRTDRWNLAFDKKVTRDHSDVASAFNRQSPALRIQRMLVGCLGRLQECRCTCRS